MNSEINDKKWFWAGVGLQFAVGYTVSFLVYFFGTLFTGANFTSVWMPILGWAIVLLIAGLLAFLIIRKNKKEKSQNA